MTVSDVVNSWFRENLAGGALGHATEAYNQVNAALPKLIDTLEASILTPSPRGKKITTTSPEPSSGEDA